MIDLDLTFAYSHIQHVNHRNGQAAVIFPNPVSDVLYLNGFEPRQVKEVTLFNSKGQQVIKTTRLTRDGIDVSRLTTGLYMVSVKGADGAVQAFKVMISK